MASKCKLQWNLLILVTILLQDKAMRKKLLMEMAPRRASDRIASKVQGKEDEESQEENERQRERERAAEERKKEEEERQREKQQQAEKRQQGLWLR